jgi:hypothetical protein
VPNRKLAAFTIIALVIIEIATVASHWGDVKARRPDFAALYSSAQLLRGGDGVGGMAEGAQVGMRPDTLHPPFETALFVPLSFFSYTTAYIVWLGCNLAMLWAVPILLWNELGALQREFHFIAIVYGSMYPVLVCLVQGQDAILLLLLLTLSYRAATARRDVLSGVLLALSLFKFQIVIPIAFLVFVARKWKLMAGFAGTAAALALVTIGLIGVRNAVNYASFVLHLGLQSAAPVDDPSLMPNLRGVMISAFTKMFSSSIITVAVIAISLVILAGSARWMLLHQNVEWSLRFAYFVLVGCVTSYHFFPHNACLLLLPILLVANTALGDGVSARERWTFSVACLTIYLAPNLLPLGIAMPLLAIASILLALSALRIGQHPSLLTLGSQ